MTKKAKPAPAPAEPVESPATRDYHITAAEPAAPQLAGRAVVAWNRIVADPLNPRKAFDEAGIDELADSIAEHGLLENLVVRPLAMVEGHGLPMHRLVAGERRWRAIGKLVASDDYPEIDPDHPVEVQIRDITDEQHAILALIENMQRKDLRPLEEAQAFHRLTEEFGLGTAEIAKSINCSQRLIQQRLQLLDLREADQQRLAEGKINVEEARRIVANYPKPLELPAATWLMALEVFAKSKSEPCEEGERETWCAAEATADPALAEVCGYPVYILSGVSPEYSARGTVKTGRFQIGPSYDAVSRFQTRFGDDIQKPEFRAELLKRLRTEVLGEGTTPPEGQWVTPWLNGTFEITPDMQAQIDASIAELTAREAGRNEAEKKRDREIGEAFNQATSIVVQARKREISPLDARFADTTNVLGNPLPWYVNAEGGIVDAKGVCFEGQYGYTHDQRIRVRRHLIVAAMNAAAGLATPEPPAADEGSAGCISRQEFLELVADQLMDEDENLELDIAQEAATAGLERLLATESIAYGDAAWDWEEHGATALARDIRDHLAKPDEEPEMSPKLKALAGVPAAEPEVA